MAEQVQASMEVEMAEQVQTSKLDTSRGVLFP